MELVKKKIHSDKIISKVALQTSLEEDINVSDSKADVTDIIFYDSSVSIEDVKVGMNKVWIKGRIFYQILYQTENTEENVIDVMQGDLPIAEEIFMENVDSQNKVICKAEIESMQVHIINSRKLNIQAIVNIVAKAEETYEKEICTELINIETDDNIDKNGRINMKASDMEYCKKNINYLETVENKRDLFRIHEEIKIDESMPEIGRLIWKNLKLKRIEFEADEGKININGEIEIFVIYKEDVHDRITWFAKKIPFNGSLEVKNCKSGMLMEISYALNHEEVTAREDTSAELRIIGIEAALEVDIRLYELKSTPVVADIYGVNYEINTNTEKVDFKNIYIDTNVDKNVNTMLNLDINEAEIEQICYFKSEIKSFESVINKSLLEQGYILIKGEVAVSLLYVAKESGKIHEISKNIPFEIEKEIPKSMNLEIEDCSIDIQIRNEKATLRDSKSIEWKAELRVLLRIYSLENNDMITDISVTNIAPEVIEKLPGFVIYYVKPEDTLWIIGKKYYVSVDSIKEINGLLDDTIKVGDKLLIVSGYSKQD